MKLTAHEKRVVFYFNDFNQVFFRIKAGNDQSPLFQTPPVIVVELIAVPVALPDFRPAVSFVSQRAGHKSASVSPKPHGSAEMALLQILFLLFHYVDYRVPGCAVYFRGVGVLQAADIAAVFNGGELHAVTKAKERNFVFPDVFYGPDFAVGAAAAESARNDDAVKI